ncbi:uncharacterized protein LOC110715963 isoform X1 [Chenopodium quinoa]|uniref:uncharacterized protein LOC110715963 isoform X1 n=1 Tax=Chenopodium quinoa TaxID=63459 RepID=UPI000B7821BC|nr:uncharacterized protein LOC110715963 isoform X1 [Chenopodium quinoa]XP_021750273.1 uncharacterized protein LOC110715963 isoform X1 [Chenopodium quinoa]
MDRMRMYDLCGKLYRLKRKSVECRNGTNNCSKKIVGDVLHVALDFVAFLPKVIRQTGVLVTGLETLYSEGQGYISWLIVTSVYVTSGMECIFSELCVDSNESVQMVAKKTIYYIMQLYNLDIVDANYGCASFRGVLGSLERESCLAVEERKKGHKYNAQPLPFLAAESPSTLSKDNSEAAVIVPAPSTPALLVLKRLSGTSGVPKSETSISSVAAKRIKFV